MSDLNTKDTIRLYDSFLQLKSTQEVANFCRDLMTEDEILEFSRRLKIAELLNEGQSQRTIAKELNVSITTVTRVNRWLTKGKGGYKAVLGTLSQVKSMHHHHKAKFAVL